MKPYIVVGSGPSGVACARALLDRGLHVVMIDAGLDLEPGQEQHRQRLASTAARDWPASSLAAVKAGMTASPSGVPLKRVFGSDFPFRVPPGAATLQQDNAHALRSFAAGGLSRAWGATLLPAAAADIAHWPVSLADLAPHYEAVMRWVPLSAAPDGLDALFPMYSDRAGDLRPSRQAADILGQLAGHQTELTRMGAVFGRARLAVRAALDGGAPGCSYCRLCLYGCPYGCIFSADQQLPELRRYPGFTYRGGVLATGVRESVSQACVDARDIASGQTMTFEGERVFLACGVVTTSQLLMQTLGIDRVRIRTSQSFLMPLVTRRAHHGIRHDEAHALTQVYVLLHDPAIARRLIQLQIYTHSELVTMALEHSFLGPAFRTIPWLKHAAEDRIVVLQGLLPSEESDDLVMTATSREQFLLTGSISSRTRNLVRRVGQAAQAIGKLGGFRALTPLVALGAPGQSFHSGASFPMSREPDPGDSDLLGRPGGLTRIHAVDATVLPDIPAPPLTLTAMANAHRIGTLAE